MNANLINTESGLPFVSTKLTTEHVIRTDSPLKHPIDVLKYMSCRLADSAREEGFAVFCGVALDPICIARVGLGSITNCYLSARDVAQVGLLCNASYVYVIHNHPGCCSVKDLKHCACSGDDVKMTIGMAEALSLIDITLVDSIVCSSFSPKRGTRFPTYYSMRFQSLFTTMTSDCNLTTNLELLAKKTGTLETYKALVDDFENVTKVEWKEFDERDYWRKLTYAEGTDEEHDLEITV